MNRHFPKISSIMFSIVDEKCPNKINHPFGSDSSLIKYLAPFSANTSLIKYLSSFSANTLKIMMNKHLHFQRF